MHPLKLPKSKTEAPPTPRQMASSATTTSTTAAAKHARSAGLSPRVGAAASLAGAAAAGTLRPPGIAALPGSAAGAALTKSATSSCRTTPRKATALGGASAAGTSSSHVTPRPQHPSEVPPLAVVCSGSGSGTLSTGHASKGHPKGRSALSLVDTPRDGALPAPRRPSQTDTPRAKKSPAAAGRTTPRTGQSPAPPLPPAVSRRLAPLKLRRHHTPSSTTSRGRVGTSEPRDSTSDEESNEPFAEMPRQTPRSPTPHSNAAAEPLSGVAPSPSQPLPSRTPHTPAGHPQHVAQSPSSAAPALSTPPPQPQPPPLPLYRVAATSSGVSQSSHRRSTPRAAAAPRVSSTARRASLAEHQVPVLVESAASLSLSLELLPSAALQLPPCTDARIQRVFEVLLPRCGDAVWDLHEHVLPFIAARQHAIMPVTPARFASFVRLTNDHTQQDEYDGQADAPGCADADTSLTMPVVEARHDVDGREAGPAAAPAPRTRFTAAALARFASQLCSWFLLLGHLSTSDATRWEALLSHTPSVPPATAAAPAPPHTSPEQRDRRASAAAWRSGTTSAVPGTPAKERRRGRPSRRSFADDPERDTADDGAGSGTVEWQTDRMAPSPPDATLGSTQGSLDFHVVVGAPPRVDQDAFRRGFHTLQDLLSTRAAQLAALKPGSLRTSLMAVCTATQTDTTAKSSELRALSRRVRFYLRLHAFVRELCVTLCAHEHRPWQRESQLIESAIAARLSASARAVRGSPGHLRRTLHAAVQAGPPGVSPNALDTLLVLSHAEATRAVHRLRDARQRVASGGTGGAPLPAALLLLFSPAGWSDGGRGWPAAPSLLGIAAVWRLVVLMATALLCFGLLFHAPIEGCGEAIVAALPMQETGCAGCGAATADHRPLDPALMLLGCGGLLVLWLGGIAACRAGAALATVELQRAMAQQHAAALASASRGWLLAAWAAQEESATAAHAVQHGVQCLQTAQDTVHSLAASTALSRSRGTGLAAVGLLILTATAVTGVSVAPALLSRAGQLLLLGLQTCAVVTIQFHAARRHHHRALSWWVRCQAATAEGFAEELVSALRCGSSDTTSGGGAGDASAALEREEPLSLGGTLTARSSAPAPSPAALAALRALCEVPLPLLEEWGKVACLVAWCAQSSRSLSRSLTTAPPPTTTRGVPADGPALVERAFWALLCAHAAPAHVSCTSAIEVVDKTMRGCWKRLEAAQAPRACVANLIARVLPWTSDAHEGCVDEQLVDVLGPLSGGETWRSASLARSCSAVGDAAAPLEVEGRRQPYLSQAQRRLVVAVACVFTVFRAAPRELHAARRRSASGGDGITAQGMALLEHLVFAELRAPHGVSAASWRRAEAEMRTRAALRLLQRVVVSAPCIEARATRPAVLLPLLETLFR